MYGRYEAFLDGPKRYLYSENKKPTKFEKEYNEYLKLYGTFDSLATTFRRELIPQTRLIMKNGKIEQEAYIPFYEKRKKETNDEKKIKIINLQITDTIRRWDDLQKAIDDLCNCDYVHAMSPFTNVIQSYHYENYTTLTNVNVTHTINVVPAWDIINKPTMQKDIERTHHWYRNVLMMVVCQNE